MGKRYDVIIVGGGHNGLAASFYLAKAGLKVLVLERREMIGGACVTEELFSGYYFSTCAYISYMLQPKIVQDMELKKHGFSVYPVDPYAFHPFPDGQRLLFWEDDDKTVEEISRISMHDAKAFLEWQDVWERAAGILQPYLLSPPPTLAEIAASLEGTRDEELLDTLLTVSIKDMLNQFFESDLVKAALVISPDFSGSGMQGGAFCSAYYNCSSFTNPADSGIAKGGMGTLTKAMARSAQCQGVAIRTNADVKQIVTEDRKAIGVLLADGEEIQASMIVSNADPLRTFLSLVGRASLDDRFVKQVERMKTNVAHMKLHCSLRELPDFSSYFDGDYDPHHVSFTTICPSVEYYEKGCSDTRQGILTDSPLIDIQIPSTYDPTLTPTGYHQMSAFVFQAPVQLQGTTWDEVKEEATERILDTLAQYAPNVRDAIIDCQLFTPIDMEQRGNLTNGNIHHLDFIPSQMLSNRPLAGWSDYRTPIDGLYLCGAGTHPGGEVTGAPGHNAAHAILQDLEVNS